MWISRNVLVWTYAIAIIIVWLAIGLRAIDVLALFALRVGLLRQVTLRYSSKPSALSALRRRLFLCSTVGLVIYAFFRFFIYTFSSTAICAILWMGVSNITPETAQAGFVAFLLEVLKHLRDHGTMGMPKIEAYVVIVAGCTVASFLEVITAYFLALGYLAMLISGNNSHPVVKRARVFDVVTFAAVGALGLGMGRALWTLLSVGRIQFLGLVPGFTGTTSEIILRSMKEVVEGITHLAGQLLVATALAEQRVLGMRV